MADNRYVEMVRRHRAEINAFPFFFAFSGRQFRAGMERFGLDAGRDADKIFKLGNSGGFYRREDAPRVREMFNRHKRELDEAIAADTAGDGFIVEMFRCELENHEYGYFGSLESMLRALGLDQDDIEKSEALKNGLRLAIRQVKWAA